MVTAMGGDGIRIGAYEEDLEAVAENVFDGGKSRG